MPEVATPNQGEREFETGADEFFKAHSELNALNGKRTYDEFQDISLTSARRSQAHFDDINARTLNSFDQLQTLQAKINEEHFASIHELRKHLANIQTDRQRHADIWTYETAYDLGNPVTTGAGDNLRGGAATANRIVDSTGAVAGAGTAVAAEAVASAVAKQVDATITPVLATLQQIVQALTTATTAIANVVNQAQPKTVA
jgi:hypothetical protein